MSSLHMSRLLPAALAVTGLLIASCGGTDGGTGSSTTTGATTTAAPVTTTAPTTTQATTTTQSTTTTSAPMEGGVAYFLLEASEDGTGPFLAPVYRELPAGDDPAAGAMARLLAGPSEGERGGIPAISTAIPEGTTLLGVEVESGIATVDLSAEFDDGGGTLSMAARLAQVTYTLTRLPGVDEVALELDGEPVGVFSSEGIILDHPMRRADFDDLLPAIFVDSPARGEPVTSPVHVVGLSNVFEAVSQVMLTDDDGLPLAEETVTATCGTGCWGEWEADLAYSVDREQVGSLIVWEISARDGSRVNIREYPVLLR